MSEGCRGSDVCVSLGWVVAGVLNGTMRTVIGIRGSAIETVSRILLGDDRAGSIVLVHF